LDNDTLTQKVVATKKYLDELADGMDSMGEFLSILSSAIVSFVLDAPDEETIDEFIASLINRLKQGTKMGKKLRPTMQGTGTIVSAQVPTEKADCDVCTKKDTCDNDDKKLEDYARRDFPGKPTA